MGKYAKSKKLPIRDDYLNLLATLRDQGFPGVRAGLKSGAFLPGLAGAVLIPALAQYSGQAPRPAGSID
jgi:hypothetical protein